MFLPRPCAVADVHQRQEVYICRYTQGKSPLRLGVQHLRRPRAGRQAVCGPDTGPSLSMFLFPLCVTYSQLPLPTSGVKEDDGQHSQLTVYCVPWLNRGRRPAPISHSPRRDSKKNPVCSMSAALESTPVNLPLDVPPEGREREH